MPPPISHQDPIVPMHHPRVLVETAVSQGATRSALLENTGITPEILESSEARISYIQFAILTDNALRLTENPALGLDFGRNVHAPNMGILGLAVMSSPNARAALEMALRHYRSLAPAWDLRLTVEGDRAILVAREVIALQPFREFATEALLAATDSLARRLLQRDLPVHQVRLHYAKPLHFERYAEMFDGPILFDQEFVEVEFDASVLKEPLPSADPATSRLAEQLVVARDSQAPSASDPAARIRGLLRAAPHRPPGLEELAETLGTSARSLRRELRELDTSYQELLDETRKARAVEWARSTDLTAEQMAEKLGFSDVRSFRRAFKRWTGQTPNAVRSRVRQT